MSGPRSSGKPDPEAVLAALEAKLDAGADDAALLERVRERVMGVLRAEARPQQRTVRADDGGWEEILPGVRRKMLWTSDAAQSCLMCLAAGARVPAHAHSVDEECLVLEGTLRVDGGLVLNAGDFHVAVRGSRHGATSTDTGALVYFRGPREGP